MRLHRTATLAAGAILASGTAAAQTSKLTATAGVSYSQGRFKAPSTTRILVAPLGLRYATGPVRLTATLPYVRIDSVGTVLVGGMMAPIVLDPADPAARRRVRDGVGDLQLGASYSLPSKLVGEWLVDVTARVKAPTAARGLGTGEPDLFVGTNVSRPIGRLAPFFEVGYRFLGDPRRFDLRNSVATSVGASYAFGRTFLIVSYDYNRAVTNAIGDANEILAAVAGPAGRRVSWTAFGSAGLSSGAPDFGVGLLFTVRS